MTPAIRQTVGEARGVTEAEVPVAVPPVPLEPTTPIRPSEAIRLGCLLAPAQSFGSLGDNGEACVMGAMYLGLGGWDGDGSHVDDIDIASGPSAEAWATLAGLGTCPSCGSDDSNPAHLNDDHRWSRERIADWLEGLGL